MLEHQAGDNEIKLSVNRVGVTDAEFEIVACKLAVGRSG